MRIIHTADWHLGQNFMGKSREPEHRAFLEWLLTLIKDQQVDALIVAGDIYDIGAPPSYARQLYSEFLVKIVSAGCQMIVVGGNHDSVAMLEESRILMDHIGICQIARPAGKPLDQVVAVRKPGSDQAPGALVCAVPFLRPRDVTKSVAGEDSATKQQKLQNDIAHHYKSVYNAALEWRTREDWNCPIIVTGHLTAVGASRSDSVREIYIGTLEAFPADAFPPADYIALGHIHGAQIVAGSETIRYSGSPIPLSFDETGRGRQKSVMMLNVAADATFELEKLLVPEYRSLQVIRGDLESIERQVSDLPLKTETDSQHSPAIWLEVIVETQDYLNDLQQRLSVLLEERNAEILLLRRQRKQNVMLSEADRQHTLNELSVDDIFEIRLKEEFGEDQPPEDQSSEDDEGTRRNSQLQDRLKTMYQQVVSEVRSGEAS